MSSRVVARCFAPALALAGLAFARSSPANYEESRITADAVRLTVDAAGNATVEHALTWRLVAGQPRSIDLLGVEPSAQPVASTALESDDGRVIAASVAPLPGRGLRVTILEPKALRHGHPYELKVAYTVNLVDSGELVRDGAAFRLAWKAPLPSEGFEAPKVTFVLPATPEPPAPLVGDGAMPDDTAQATLRRAPDHDELELVRPHVGRGEPTVWAVRVPAKAFDAGKSPALAPPPPPPVREEPPGPGWLAYGVIAALGLALVAAVRLRDRRLAALMASAAEPGPVRGLLPLGGWERAATAGALLFVGVSLQIAQAPMVGTLAIAAAMAASVVRVPLTPAPPRGPAKWLALRPGEAFPATKRDLRGPLLVAGILLAATALFVGASRLLARVAPEALVLVPLDAVVVAPLLVTGHARRPDLRCVAGAWLAPLFARLSRLRGVRVSAWGRVPPGVAEPDEVRVRVVPRDPMPGLGMIEIGLASARSSTSFVTAPEVLVRVDEASAASARMTTLLPDVVPLPGRKAEERVYRIRPRLPTRGSTHALVVRLGRNLVDRRVAEGAWEQEERRVDPGARPRLAEAAAAVG